MTADKVREVVDQYRRVFETDPWAGEMWPDYPHSELLDSPKEGTRHCALLLDQIEAFVRAGRIDKALYRLGFVQGFLAVTGRFAEKVELKETLYWFGFAQGLLWATGNLTLNDLQRYKLISA